MAEKMAIPWETKYKFAIGGYTSILKGFLHTIREKFDGATALEIYDMMMKDEDRVKNLTNVVKSVFKIEGNDAETMVKWWDIWWEITGVEGTVLEQSKTSYRTKITKCPWKTEGKDISNWIVMFANIVDKTINPKATVERPKGMCAGDPYCEYVMKIE